MKEDDYIPISALQHFAYCPRQCAFIHIEQAWAENFFTAEGNILHQKVNHGEPEKRKSVRTERNVALVSHDLKIHGFADVIEITHKTIITPVEYKRGKPKIAHHDRIQLCAQALCLEEMHHITIEKAALWYFETRHREDVLLNEELRSLTLQTIHNTAHMFQASVTPPPQYETKKCNACSLKDLCNPKLFAHDKTRTYLNSLYNMDEIL